MGTNGPPVVAGLLLFCSDRNFMLSLSDENQFKIIEAFSSTSPYMYGLLNIDNNFFDCIFSHIYPSELQLKKANVSDTEASIFYLHLSIYRMILLKLKLMINKMILILIF